MEKKIILNPFNIQMLVILAILFLYSFNWSYLTKPLTPSFILFLLFVLSNLLLFSKLFNVYFRPKKYTTKSFKEPPLFWILLGFASMLAEFMYEKVIPIVEILILNHNYNYVNFKGIPGFHVIAVTYTSFLGLWLWDIFIQNKQIRYLLLSLFFLSFPLMLFNRGGFIFNCVTAVFIFLYRKKTIQLSVKNLLVIVGSLIVFSYFFGVFGNFRSESAEQNYRTKGVPDSTYILNIGDATEEFRKNNIPKEFFWTYLYACTPIANLQNIIKENDPMNDMQAFLAMSVFPDFIGKRIIKNNKIFIPKDRLIRSSFNVSTYFADAYKTMGYYGLIIILYVFAMFVFGFAYLFSKIDGQGVVGMSVLFTIAIFSLFSNMMTFSGLSFQLVYPVLFSIYKKI